MAYFPAAETPREKKPGKRHPTPGAKIFREHLKQKEKFEKKGQNSNENSNKKNVNGSIEIINSINRVRDQQKLAANYQLKGSDIRSKAKEKALIALKSDMKNDSRINKILQRVNLNRQKAESKLQNVNENNNKENQSPKSKSKIDYSALIKQKSQFEDQKEAHDSRQADLFWKTLEKRDEKMLKDLATNKEETTIQTCNTCKYTYWTAHPTCKSQHHNIVTKKAMKKFFACPCKKARVVTWHVYPNKSCWNCGKIAWEKTGKISMSSKLQSEKLEVFTKGIGGV